MVGVWLWVEKGAWMVGRNGPIRGSPGIGEV